MSASTGEKGITRMNRKLLVAPLAALAATSILLAGCGADDSAGASVELGDFTFKFDAKDIKPGTGSVEFENKGKQTHEAVLAKVAPGVNVQEALSSDGPPEGVEVLFVVAEMKPGDRATYTVGKNLEKGHYVMVCTFPDTSDAQGTPHFAKGMISEFDIS